MSPDRPTDDQRALDALQARNAAHDARRLGGTTGVAYGLSAIAQALLATREEKP